MAAAEKRRVTIHDNRNTEEAKILMVPSNCTLSSFLQLASQKLNMPARKLYSSDGALIDEIDIIRDNDIIFVSAGEPFHKNANHNNSSAASSSSSSSKEQARNYQIAVMGPGAVGKSALTLRFVQGKFVKDYDPTIEDAYRKTTTVDEESCVLDILDTAGQEDYTALRSTWMRDRDGFLLVYSVVDRLTFDALRSFYDHLSALHEDDIPPIILVGNKSDLSHKRQVNYNDGKKLSDSFKNCQYLETSAKSGENVDKAFHELIRAMKQRENAKNAKNGGKGDGKKKKKGCNIL